MSDEGVPVMSCAGGRNLARELCAVLGCRPEEIVGRVKSMKAELTARPAVSVRAFPPEAAPKVTPAAEELKATLKSVADGLATAAESLGMFNARLQALRATGSDTNPG